MLIQYNVCGNKLNKYKINISTIMQQCVSYPHSVLQQTSVPFPPYCSMKVPQKSAQINTKHSYYKLNNCKTNHFTACYWYLWTNQWGKIIQVNITSYTFSTPVLHPWAQEHLEMGERQQNHNNYQENIIHKS